MLSSDYIPLWNTRIYFTGTDVFWFDSCVCIMIRHMYITATAACFISSYYFSCSTTCIFWLVIFHDQKFLDEMVEFSTLEWYNGLDRFLWNKPLSSRNWDIMHLPLYVKELWKVIRPSQHLQTNLRFVIRGYVLSMGNFIYLSKQF